MYIFWNFNVETVMNGKKSFLGPEKTGFFMTGSCG
jgi:hypothetical protein